MTDVEPEPVAPDQYGPSPQRPANSGSPDKVPRDLHRQWVKAKDAAVSAGRDRYRQENLLLDWKVARQSVLGDERKFLTIVADDADRYLDARRTERQAWGAAASLIGVVFAAVGLVLGLPWWPVLIGVAISAVPAVALMTSPELVPAPGLAPSVRLPMFRLADALKKVLDPEIDHWVDGLLRTPAGNVHVRSTLGLSELIDESYEVPTQTAALALRTMRSMRGASIGLAGVRGAGKSTLMRALARGRLRESSSAAQTVDQLTYGTVVAAPVKYSSEDFIAHLFSSLCLNILGRDPDDSPWAQGAARWAAGFFGGAGLVVAGWMVLSKSHIGLNHTSARDWIAVAAIGLGTAAFLWGYTRLFLRVLFGRSPRTLARRHLHALRNLDTVSTTISGLAGPTTANVSARRTVESARRALALPDLVASYKRFVAVLAADRPVIIGIDELDKMESDQEARQFLNDIKTVFGQENCYYLVSVSEDALSAFDRRGMPLRDVFDSAFDVVLPIGPLTATESALLLSRRVVGLGAAAKLLCHALSGGLPRDLIRAARDVAESATAAEPEAADQPAAADVKLTDIVWAVAVRRVAAAQRAATTVAQRFAAADGTQPLLAWLAGLPPLANQDAKGLRDRWQVRDALAAVAHSQLPAEDRQELTLIALQFAVLAFHTATVIDQVRALNDGDLEEMKGSLEPDLPADLGRADGASVAETPLVLTRFETLARARVEMAVSPAVAWQTIAGLRADDETFPSDQSRRWRRRVRSRLRRSLL
jgi:energy-coupling factor transporter ATP-binding protein EcfA2